MPNIIQPVRNLPNGTRINGIEHIYQAAKPTTRVDGSALVVGDRWYKPSIQTELIWNGTYWLSATTFLITAFQASAYTATYGTFTPDFGYLIEKVSLRGYLGSRNATNYYTYSFRIKNLLSSNTFLWQKAKTSLELGENNKWGWFEEYPNFALFPVVGNDAVIGVEFAATTTGNPGFCQYCIEVQYRKIHL